MPENAQNRRDFLKLVAAASTLGFAAGGCNENQSYTSTAGAAGKKITAKRPNIILIVADDQRKDMMSCAGNKHMQTPHFDKMAKQGLFFENAFCTSGVCSPSRASFMTGQHPHQCGAPGIIWENNTFLRNAKLFPQYLQQQGYHTAHFGKWHLGKGSQPQKGYDYWAGFDWLGKFYDTQVHINGQKKQFKGYSDDILSDLTAKHINKMAQADQPFFIYLGLKAPHLPFAYARRYDDYLTHADIPKPETYNENFDETGKLPQLKDNLIMLEKFHGGLPMFKNSWDVYVKSYYRASKCLDDATGTILNAVDQAGIAEDTLIIYTSDQGYSLGEHGLTEKHYAYEQVMRIPMLVRYPRMIKPNTRLEQMVLNIDVAPTILDLAGIDVPQHMQGKSWKPILTENKKAKWRKDFFWKQESERQLIPGQIAVRTDRYKLITYQSFDHKELYDLKKDPQEIWNLACKNEYSGVLKDMEKRLARLKKETNYRPWINIKGEAIYLIGPVEDADIEQLTQLATDAISPLIEYKVNGRKYKWQKLDRSRPNGYDINKIINTDTDKQIFIGSKIDLLIKTDPYTRARIAPHQRKYIGYINGEKIWDSSVGVGNHLNPPLITGTNSLVLITSARDLNAFEIGLNAPQATVKMQ
jgi:N-acetylglucosamine-6-sulfatase